MAAPVKKQVKTAPVAKPLIFPFSFKMKCQILAIIGFVFYINSFTNRYALDDNIAIERNSYVQMGVAGIPKILTTDSYYSYYKDMGGDPSQQLKGGRYRPLSEIIFAVEKTLFGWLDAKPDDKDSKAEPTFIAAHIMHLINVIAFIICLISIFYFLDRFLLVKIPGGSDMAFLATVLFAIHPLHTEVVANIKSLDEIISITFIMLTFIYSIRFLREKTAKLRLLACLFLLLALLSKEYALTLVFFIPFLFYLLEGKKPFEAITASIPYFGVVVIYILLRLNAVGFNNTVIGSTDILSNPYLYATPTQVKATEWFVMGKYIKLLFLPYPLSSDYSYYQITYHNFSDMSVIFSILFYLGIVIWGIRLFLKKDVLSFAILFFLFNIFMISNFVIDIGATMGERLVFHSSLGLVIILAYYAVKGVSKMSLDAKRKVVFGVVSIIGVVCLGETVVRNTNWDDDTTLFIHDVGVVPNSCRVNNNAGWGYLGLSEKVGNTVDQAKADLDSARKYSLRAIYYDPKYEGAYLNLGGVYLHQGMLDSAKYCWDMVEKIHPNFPGLPAKFKLISDFSKSLFAQGLQLGQSGKPREGLSYMRRALVMDTANFSNIWYNIGGAYFTIQKYDSAKYAWTKALQYNPNNMDAQRGLQASYPELTDESIMVYLRQ